MFRLTGKQTHQEWTTKDGGTPMKKKTLLALAGLALSPLALAAPDVAAPSVEQQIAQLQAQVNALQVSQRETPDWVNRLTIHGFATFGLQITDDHDGVLYGAAVNDNGKLYPGVGDSWDQNGLSRAGLQVGANLDEAGNTRLVTQFLARGKYDYNVNLQWAYLSHKFTPDFTVRAGRLVVPFYMHSQYNDVGYAYPWVTLPDEVYSTVPADTADGIDLAWNLATGPAAHTLGLQWANTNIYATTGNYHVQNMISANLSSTWNALTVRIGYSGGKVDHTIETCPPYLNPADPGDAATLAGCLYANAMLAMDGKYAYFADAGFKYDDGRFLLTGEWVQLDVSGYFPKTRSSYVTTGVHLGRWLPNITYGMQDTSDRANSTIPGLGTVAQQQQRRIGYGLRFDATNHVSVKAELSHIYGTDGTIGQFVAVPLDTSTRLVRLSVDATF